MVFLSVVVYSFQAMIKGKLWILALTAAVFFLACSKRQIVPGIVAGVGGATFASGVIYRAALPEEDSDGLFGRQADQKAVTATLVFSGVALIVAGVIWSATTPLCEADIDCFRGDVCEPATRTCVEKRLEPPQSESPSAAHLFPLAVYDKYKLNFHTQAETKTTP
jgi:hypothetical protein